MDNTTIDQITKSNTTGNNDSETSATKSTTGSGTPDGDKDYCINTKGLSTKTVYQFEGSAFKDQNIMEHDIMRMVVCLQGLINRDFEKNQIAVYLNTTASDPFWLSYISGSGKLLNGFKTVKITSLNDILSTFKNQLINTGMITWDQDVPSTANVASTICGLDGYIPVKYDTGSASLYNKLKQLGVPEKMSLVGKLFQLIV